MRRDASGDSFQNEKQGSAAILRREKKKRGGRELSPRLSGCVAHGRGRRRLHDCPIAREQSFQSGEQSILQVDCVRKTLPSLIQNYAFSLQAEHVAVTVAGR
jgi:hypothetical protein